MYNAIDARFGNIVLAKKQLETESFAMEGSSYIIPLHFNNTVTVS